MAQKQKRPSPLDEPPTASSSDSEEDQQPSSQPHDEEEEEEEDEEEVASSEEDDDEEDHQPSSALQPPSKNPPPAPANFHPKPSSSESATESDSGSDSEPEPPPPAANPKVKPLASKPMEQTPKARPSSSATPARSGTKRAAENNVAENNTHATDPKKAKKKVTAAPAASADVSNEEVEEDGKKIADDSKKLFQRLWSEEDEIAILKGMVEFTSKTGMDPFKHANEFHDFVKKALHVDASSNQLKEKIRRLKKKFETHAGKGKNGEGPKFSKAHDQKAFELSKKVWANGEGGAANGVIEKAKSNGKASKKEVSSKNVASPKKPKPETKPASNLDSKEPEMMDIDKRPDKTFLLSEMIRFGKGMSLSGLNEDVVKRGLELLEPSNREELEGKWMKLQVAELELFAKRAKLIEDQTRLILEAYKSSNH